MTNAPVTLRQAAIARTSALADVVLILGGALLVALAAQVQIPLIFTPVPISGQTFAVVLVGGALGAWRAGTSMALYVLLGGLGLPFYAGAESGWQVVRGASGGYLIGFIAAALLVGWLAERGWDRRFGSAIGAMLSGNVLIYLFGLPWLSWTAHLGLKQTLELGLYPFVPGDILKLYLAAAVLPGAWKVVSRLSKS